MKLPVRAKLVIAATVFGALAGVAAVEGASAQQGLGSVWVLAVFIGLVLASWHWPIVMYQDSSSQAHHLDEGFFLVMALVLNPREVLLVFAVSIATAEVIRRRPPVKSLFNVAQILLAASAGLLTIHLLAAPTGRLSLAELAAGAVGATVYFLVNSFALAAVLAATGAERIRPALLDGLEIRSLLLAASVALGIVSALALSAYPASAVFVGIPFWAFRQTLAGHFEARHDRTRLLGLFDATLDVHRTMGSNEVTTALQGAAASLLRCPDAVVVEGSLPDNEGVLAAPMQVQDSERWLVVRGRSRSEPFDEADKGLLDALAALGSSALENASLYEEGRRQKEWLVAITSSLGEGVCAFDAGARLSLLNPTAEALFGWTVEELREMEAGDPDGGQDHLDCLRAPALQSMRTLATVKGEGVSWRRKGGDVFAVDFTCSPILDGDLPLGAVVAFRDITERKAMEDQLAHHAFHDALTGLPNRRLFLDRLTHAIHRSERTSEMHAVFFADVDRFKFINDNLGHQAGDQILRSIADRLTKVLRPSDTLARFGGDEFMLLVEDIPNVEAAETVGRRILEVMRAPVVVDGGREVLAQVSIGIAFTSGRASADDILHDADVAMYEAKHRGAGRYEVFDASAMEARSAERIDLEAGLRRALEADEMEVFYQPLVATADGRVVGAEALVRWNHPTQGLLAPGHFIGLAEETGLILPLGRKVLEQACQQGRAWTDQFGVPLSISVNLSPRQFQDHGLVAEVKEVIERTGFSPSQLCLEITESLAVQDVVRTAHTLNELKALGVRLAMDDFGTGYSSLSYLKQFPLDVVKIDRSFLQDLDDSSIDSAIVGAVMNLVESVGMTAVAEGVETAHQLAVLASMGCQVVQGYHLAKPMPAEPATRFICQSLRRSPKRVAALPSAKQDPVVEVA
ncbi:MAG TPA: EAL domain-containing protein [Acidimicrobiales bacterium]|nr:EAL domain-containing protein [Acidimicrobiales bacterium]